MSSPLVVNADDLGVSRGATLGIVRAHREGIVTSASLAPTTPSYGHALDTCVRACPGLGVGLHFTLTSGRPVTPAAQVPLLIDRRGFFRWRFTSLLWHAGIRRRRDLLDQIDLELESQIRRLQADGVRPDHINGERHVQLIPGIFERVVAAAARHGIPFVRAGKEIQTHLSNNPYRPVSFSAAGLAKSLLLGRLTARDRRRLGEGARSADRFASYLFSGRLDVVMRRILERPPATGVTEIMVHPGVPEESRGIDLGNPDVERYLTSQDRVRELEACIEARQWTQRPSGWVLTTFGELGRRPGPRPA